MTRAVNILGAGPSGISAAIALADGGFDVHLHERYDQIGKRFQGDLQGLENWTQHGDVLDQLRGFGIGINFEATPFHEVIMSDGKKSFTQSSKEPLFYLVKRGVIPNSLDTALHQQALNKNIKFHYRSTLPREEADIIATGPIRKSVIASDKGIIFKTDLPNIAVALYNDEIAYLGYSYLLIANGYGCLCSVVFRETHRLNACFEQTVQLAKRLYPIRIENEHQVGGIGSFCLSHPKQIGKSRLVGEAAGLQDLLWGFGIRTALTSGNLAARSILNDEDYSELVSKELIPYSKAGIVTRYLWETIKFRNKPLLPTMLSLPLSMRTDLRFLYRFSLFHRLLYPIAKRYINKHYENAL